MRSARLFSLVLGNLRRSRNHFLLASIGIVVGIATFAFFLSLGLGVRAVVLGKIFPLDQLEVVPRSLAVNVGPLRMGMGKDALDDEMVAKLRDLPGVDAVYPKMKLTVGSIAYGGESLFGSDLRSEVVADGIDPELVADEINEDGFAFVDYDAPDRLAAEPPVTCEKDEECGEQMYCGSPPGTTKQTKTKTKSRTKTKTKPNTKARPKRPSTGRLEATIPTRTDARAAAAWAPTAPAKPAQDGSAPAGPKPKGTATPKPSTADAKGTAPAGSGPTQPGAPGADAPPTAKTPAKPGAPGADAKPTAKAPAKPAAKAAAEPEPAKVCRHFVPVIVSQHVVELYNGTLRRAHNFPQLNPEAVRGFTFDLIIGESMVLTSKKDRTVHDRGMFVGFTDKAIPLGMTLPLGYVQRYNVEFGNEQDAQRYHSVILQVPVKDDVAQVAKGVDDLDLEVKDSGAEQAALLIAVFMMVFGLVSAVIVGIAAVNIMHVFFMLVYERQREIGVMRAVGASRGDVARIILGEAAVLGTLAGTAGIALAFAAASLFDQVSVSYVPDFPYKPSTYFEFPWWLIVSALAFSVSFCILGALLPARRAARMEPARVLSGN